MDRLRHLSDRLAPALRMAIVIVALAWLSTPAQAFDLQAHRGGRGLMPENTLAAFQHALALGVDTLELDIAITADGVPVISHDPALQSALTRDSQGRWLSGPGPLIRSLTLAQLQQYDVGRIDPASPYARQFPAQQSRDGERVPTLAALFALVRNRGADTVRFNIETKIFPDRPDAAPDPAEFLDRLLPVIQNAAMAGRVTIQSFDWRSLQLTRQRIPAMETVYLTLESPRANTVRDGRWTAGMAWRDHASTAHMVQAAGGTTWSPRFNDIDASSVGEAHRLGLKLIPWTVNDASDMDRLIGWGVDGIITDYPDRLRAAMQRAGLALPVPHAGPK